MGSSWTKPLADGRIVVVSAAGEDEVDGAYVEMARPVVSNKENRPSFVYAGRTRGNAECRTRHRTGGKPGRVTLLRVQIRNAALDDVLRHVQLCRTLPHTCKSLRRCVAHGRSEER